MSAEGASIDIEIYLAEEDSLLRLEGLLNGQNMVIPGYPADPDSASRTGDIDLDAAEQ